MSFTRSSKVPKPRRVEGAPRRSRARNRSWCEVLACAGVALLLAACAGGDEPPVTQTAEPEYDGLSREQIEQAAEQMTLEEAERLGIVDTTIRIESPVNPDSIIPPVLDTAARP